jgi:hypothetical protein
MRLIDLNPRWTGSSEIKEGLTFDCPHCRTQRLGLLFKNPIDPNGWLAKGVTRHHDKNEWDRVGETFETLTLTPSINTTNFGFDSHWHGFIKDGEIV